MADAISVSGADHAAPTRPSSFETGKLAQQSQGAVVATHRRHHRAGHRQRRQGRP